MVFIEHRRLSLALVLAPALAQDHRSSISQKEMEMETVRKCIDQQVDCTESRVFDS